MATYYPNTQFLIKQLKSLDNQTYQDIELYVCDDSGNIEAAKEVKNIINKTLKKIKWFFYSNEKNLGSNKTFERLTILSEGIFLCYCDQDDKWEVDKIERLLKNKTSNDCLVYSDLNLINSDDDIIATSFKEDHPRLIHVEGAGATLFDFFLRRNSVTGCTMLLDSYVAKASLPFPPQEFYVHDHWLALNACIHGNIKYVNESLVGYRIHGNNQIGNSVLAGINDKKTYYEKRIMCEYRRSVFLKNSNRLTKPSNAANIEDYYKFIILRKNIFEIPNLSNLKALLPTIKKDKLLILFEIFLAYSPKIFGRKIISRIRK